MAKDVVITPLYRRPEFFKIWTDLLQNVDQAGEMFYIFCLDYGYDHLHEMLLKDFPFEFGTVHTPKTSYKLTKQSYNVLNGLMVGAKWSDNLVFYVEEDVFIGKDFFRWHREVHRQQKDIFCSIGTRNNNTRFEVTDNQDYYYLSTEGDYQSLGSCFKKEVLTDLIGPHFTNEYFKNPVVYCRDHFKGSKIGPFFVEQDGLIRRILEQSQRATAFPHVPRGFHGGIYGYNRTDLSINRLSFTQKVNKILQTAFDHEALKNYVKHPEYYQDSKPCELNTDFKRLKNKQVSIDKTNLLV